MDAPHFLRARLVDACPILQTPRTPDRLTRIRWMLATLTCSVVIVGLPAARAFAQEAQVAAPAAEVAAPAAPAPQPEPVAEPAKVEPVVPSVLAPVEMGTVLAEADAALANPTLGEDARHVVELFKLVNQARAEHGLYPLRMDARLVASAQAHASNMSHAHYCRHSGLDGSSAKARIRQAGYAHNNWAGENIICSRWTAADAMGWWLNSSPHRRNILHGNYTHIGIGYDPAGLYGPSWVLNFGAGPTDTIGVSYMPASGSTMP